MVKIFARFFGFKIVEKNKEVVQKVRHLVVIYTPKKPLAGFS